MDQSERDLAIRAVLAEAGDQGPVGQAAVASVIRNRAISNGNYGQDKGVKGVITKPYAFEPMLHYGTGKNNDPARFDPNSDAYQSAGKIVDAVFSGQHPDPSNGATHFVSPGGQSAAGRNMPTWATPDTQTAKIGGHEFYAPEGKVDLSNMPNMAAAPAAQPGASAAPAQSGQQALMDAFMKSQGGGAQQPAGHQAGLLGQLLFGPQGLSGVAHQALPQGILGGVLGAAPPGGQPTGAIAALQHLFGGGAAPGAAGQPAAAPMPQPPAQPITTAGVPGAASPQLQPGMPPAPQQQQAAAMPPAQGTPPGVGGAQAGVPSDPGFMAKLAALFGGGQPNAVG